MESADKVRSPNTAAIEAAENVYQRVQRAFPEAVADFESKWTAFQAACNSLPTSTSPVESTRTSEFEALKKQGPKILAFVVFKLATGADQNSYGVFLFNALVHDPKYRETQDDDIISKEVMQRYSSHIVELSYQLNTVYMERVDLWKGHCRRNERSSSTGGYCSSEEYWDLVEVGPAFIPHLMVDYSHDRGGFWYELLHEIVHGHTMGAYMLFDRDEYFHVWREFLNGGEYDQAPKYVPTEWDVYFSSAGKTVGPQLREYFRQRET